MTLELTVSPPVMVSPDFMTNAVESRPSSKSAFRLGTFTELPTVNGGPPGGLNEIEPENVWLDPAARPAAVPE